MSFSVKCLVFLVLDITLFHYKPKAFNIDYNKYLRSIKGFFSNHRNCNYGKPRLLQTGIPWQAFAIGASVVFDHDKKDIYSWKFKQFTSVNFLLSKGYKYDESTNLILPAKYSINADEKVLKQLDNFKDSDNIYVRISNKGAALLSYMKGRCTNTLNRQFDLFRVKDFPNSPAWGIIDTHAMQEELKLMNIKKDESYTYGFMNMLLTYFFRAENGYIVSPQSKQTGGQVDFVVKRNNQVICVVESKGLAAKNYPLTHLYAQVTEYANTNHSLDHVFTIVNKGPFISFGIYIQDFHTINNFKRKCIFFDGYIGLQVDKNLSVKPVPQINVFAPNHKLYKAGDSFEQNKSIYTCLEYIEHHSNDIHAKFLDFGAKCIVDEEGGIDNIKKSARSCVNRNGKIYDKS